ncbi:hypothetical protein NEIPOLOT_01073 [Neisseria polysaccharea ATCC 43768]|nr:hypothetical protein NEIPOLOT_01073 [Neisseria polysaccharea ATCC 43768]
METGFQTAFLRQMELISPITYWNGKVLLDLDSLYTRPQI